MIAPVKVEAPQLQRVKIAGEEVLYSPGAVMGFEFAAFAGAREVTVFQCAVCKGQFEQGWSEAEAEAELRGTYGDTVRKEECAVLCGDCYSKVMAWMAEEAPRA